MDQILKELGNILHLPLTLPVLFAAVQIILDLLLIIIVLFLLKRISSFDAGKLEAVVETLKESHELCEQLNRTVVRNAEIAGKIQSIMDERDAGRNERAADASGASTSDSSRVRELWRKGATIEEISEKTGLSKGEVEVITSLLKQK